METSLKRKHSSSENDAEVEPSGGKTDTARDPSPSAPALPGPVLVITASDIPTASTATTPAAASGLLSENTDSSSEGDLDDDDDDEIADPEVGDDGSEGETVYAIGGAHPRGALRRHHLTRKQLSRVQVGGGPGEGTTSSGQHVPTRMSHRMAERKRRKDMGALFEELKDLLPIDETFTKATKGNLLSSGTVLSECVLCAHSHFLVFFLFSCGFH